MMTGAAFNHVVQTPDGVLYVVFLNANSDPVYRKSLDGGVTWNEPVQIAAITATALAVWYDRWSNISAGLIHCAYTDSGTSDTLYRTIDTESSDALSTQTTIFAGTSQASGQHLSICRARGGNVYCDTVIDAGAEGGFHRLLNANVPNGAWASRTSPEAIATNDFIILQPGWAADNQDMLAFFWDNSASEVSRYVYDDSANSWAETSIAASMTKASQNTSFPCFAAAVDISNSRSLLVAWSATDSANADLRCWHVTESAITEVTNVVLNSTDDQGTCAIGIDTSTGHWYVFYCGESGGSETFPTAVGIYYKKSTDSGSTWSAEARLDTFSTTIPIETIFTVPRFTGPPKLAYSSGGGTSTSRTMRLNVDRTVPRAALQLGV